MQKKKRKPLLKRSYDYARDYTVSPSGEVIYNGLYYEFTGKDHQHTGLFRKYMYFSITAFMLIILSGLIPVASMKYSPFVIFPFGLEVVFGFVLLAACLRTFKAKQPMTRRTFNISFGRLFPVSFITALLSAVIFAGNVYFILTHLYLGVVIPEYIFGLAQGTVAVLSARVCVSCRKIRYRAYDSSAKGSQK